MGGLVEMFVFLVFWGVIIYICLVVRGRKIRSFGYFGDLRVLDNGLICVRGKFSFVV